MKITKGDIEKLVLELGEVGALDIEWSEALGAPASAEDFASEAIFVICNSGMKNTVARRIFERVMDAIGRGESASVAFGHRGKAEAIDAIWRDRDRLLAAYLAAVDKVEFCATLPWIGGITKYHLAKNFGANVAKPDVHLQRLADYEGTTPQALCERLAAETGYRVATVDLILWRACANGLINSRANIRERGMTRKMTKAQAELGERLLEFIYDEVDQHLNPDGEECWYCGGEGETYDCFDGCCEDAGSGCPDCARPCPECRIFKGRRAKAVRLKVIESGDVSVAVAWLKAIGRWNDDIALDRVAEELTAGRAALSEAGHE